MGEQEMDSVDQGRPGSREKGIQELGWLSPLTSLHPAWALSPLDGSVRTSLASLLS